MRPPINGITYDRMVECSGASRPTITAHIKTIRMMLELIELEKWLKQHGGV